MPSVLCAIRNPPSQYKKEKTASMVDHEKKTVVGGALEHN